MHHIMHILISQEFGVFSSVEIRHKVIAGSNFQIRVGGFTFFGCQMPVKPVYHSASLKEQGEKSDNKGAWVKKRIERSLRKYSPVKNKLQRIMDCFGLERILKVIWFQHLCHEQEHLGFCHVAQKRQCSSLALNTGWGTHGFSGQPVSVLDHLTLKNFFLIF